MSHIVLPFPPSVNNLFVNVPGKGRVRTKDYNAWRLEAGLELRSQRPEKHKGPVDVEVRLHAPDKRRRDADNSLKAVLDLLKLHQVIEDDHNQIVRSIYARWADDGEPCVVTVRAA